MQKGRSERDGRNHCRLSVFIAFISVSRAMPLKIPTAGSEQNLSTRRQIDGVKSHHTSALWDSTPRRRRNHARGRRPDDYNRRLNASCEGRSKKNKQERGGSGDKWTRGQGTRRSGDKGIRDFRLLVPLSP